MTLVIDNERTLARYGSLRGQVVVICSRCDRESTALPSSVAMSACPRCEDPDQPAFPVPVLSPEFEARCVRRLHGRFYQAERANGVRWPREGTLLAWLGFTGPELALHIAEQIAVGCYYCRREIPDFFHVCHISPVCQITSVIELWQTFQLHNVSASHAECNIKQPRRTE